MDAYDFETRRELIKKVARQIVEASAEQGLNVSEFHLALDEARTHIGTMPITLNEWRGEAK